MFAFFTPGHVLTAADVNNIMNQTVIPCTSGTRPTSPVAGMFVTESDTGDINRYDGTSWVTVGSVSAWKSYTPTFTNITSGAGLFAYKLFGKTLKIRGYFSAGTYTATGLVSVSLPGTAAVVGIAQVVPGIGVGLWAVSSGGTVVTAQTSNTAGTALSGAYFNGEIEVQ